MFLTPLEMSKFIRVQSHLFWVEIFCWKFERKKKKQIHELEIEPGGGGVGVVMHHQTTKDSRISFGEFGGGEKEREREGNLKEWLARI